MTYPMTSKDEVLEKFDLFLADVGKPQKLLSDGALEFEFRGTVTCAETTGSDKRSQRPKIIKILARSRELGALEGPDA